MEAHAHEDVELGVLRVLAKYLGLDEREVRADASLLDDLNIDSLEFMAVVIDLEERFGVKLPDAEAARLKTVAEVVAAVRKQTSAVAA